MGIEIEALAKTYGKVTALEDIGLSVPSGGLTALLGPSGSGKTTLLRILGGQETADSGSVRIDGRDVTGIPPQRRNIGFVFQHYAAFKHLSVARNVAFGLEIRRWPKAEIRRRVDELLDLVQLSELGERHPNQLSGGQRQRMALARALAIEPSVLLLDEPFGALDAKVRKELRDWLRRLHDEVHVTSVFVTHDQQEALEVADTVVVVNQGRIEQAGTPEEIYDHPVNDFVFEFIGESTSLAGQRLRPHDVEVSGTERAGALPGSITQWKRVGFEVRLEVTLQVPDTGELLAGESVTVQLTRPEAHELGLQRGDPVWVRQRPVHGPAPLTGLMRQAQPSMTAASSVRN